MGKLLLEVVEILRLFLFSVMSKTKGVNMKLYKIFIVFIFVIFHAVVRYKQVHYQIILASSWQ
jgi:hypothetical protein